MYFPWILAEAALPILNVSCLFKRTVFEKELIKTNETAINAKS
jgi:hypothetical protein